MLYCLLTQKIEVSNYATALSFKPDKNIKLDQKLDESTFKMDIPDGVEVIDISP